MRRLGCILLTLWAGSLWTVCGIVAPTLFATLDERHVAGQVAARLFHIEAWLGLVLGSALMGIHAMSGVSAAKAFPWLIAVTAAAPLASEFILGPMMDAARLAGDMARFGMLHAVAAVLFATACAGALALVWSASRPVATCA